LGQLPQDSSVTYSEKVITLTPSAPANGAAAGAKAASPTGPRKSAKGGFVPEGAYPLDGERTVEKAREHYERCTRESLVKIHQASTFPTQTIENEYVSQKIFLFTVCPEITLWRLTRVSD
jgi:hypothetical protein